MQATPQDQTRMGWQTMLAYAIVAAIPIFSVSQKTLIPLLTILCFLAGSKPHHAKTEWTRIETIQPSLAWIAPGLAFTALASRNAFNDIGTGLITSSSDLSAFLTRACLYTAIPLVLLYAGRRLLLNCADIGRSILAGLQIKMLACLALTPILTGEVARKGYILQIPTLEKFVTTWTGTYFLLSAALACFLLWQHANDEHKQPLDFTLISASTLQAFYSAAALNNLTCTVAGLVLLVISFRIIPINLSILKGALTTKRASLVRQKYILVFILITGIIGSSTFGHHLKATLINIAEILRIEHLWTRNDRLEFFVQGAKRLLSHPPTADYLVNGPPYFQRPICFKDAEVTFTYGDSCHNYWHSILWDSLRNSGYIGLLLGIIIVISLAISLYKFAQARKPLLALAICCCLLIVFTTPIVEVGAGEILPLMLVITVINSVNPYQHDQGSKLKICPKPDSDVA